MRPNIIGKSILLRDVEVEDAEFIHKLRCDEKKSKYISATRNDLDAQIKYIQNYRDSITDYYFIICNLDLNKLGTVRIYDVRGDSFCWGSWILADNAPKTAAIESVLLIYDFAFYSLHFKKSHFDVRKLNTKVVEFHKRLGAIITSEDELNFYFSYGVESYEATRKRFLKFLR